MAYFYFTDGVIKFNEKLDCRMDVVFFHIWLLYFWKLLNTYYSWNCIETKKTVGQGQCIYFIFDLNQIEWF